MRTVLGIDAGGTKTVVALVDETGAVLKCSAFPGLDPTRAVDAETELGDFLQRVMPSDAAAPQAATVGLPFHGEIGPITAMQRARVAQSFGANARACNDVEVAHIGAFGGGDGVLVLSGTGSMAWAKGPAGISRAGGFGDLIGDDGSAYWIGQRALAFLSRHIDGRRPAPAFCAGLTDALGIDTDGLIEWVYGQSNPRAGIASIARHVSTLAAAGMADAVSILRQAAAELADTAKAAARTAGLVTPHQLSTAGSVFRDPVVLAELARLTNTKTVTAVLPPVGGAVLDAALRAGWAIGQPWMSRLDRELARKAPVKGRYSDLYEGN